MGISGEGALCEGGGGGAGDNADDVELWSSSSEECVATLSRMNLVLMLLIVPASKSSSCSDSFAIVKSMLSGSWLELSLWQLSSFSPSPGDRIWFDACVNIVICVLWAGSI